MTAATFHGFLYALFRCPVCPLEDCGERPGSMSGGWCECSWADDLPQLTDDDELWPVCKCCGAKADLVSPLVALEAFPVPPRDVRG